MSVYEKLEIDLHYQKEQICDFEEGYQKVEEIIANIKLSVKEVIANIKLQELASRGLIRPASGAKIEISLPPKFSGKPLSEYVKEGRE